MRFRLNFFNLILTAPSLVGAAETAPSLLRHHPDQVLLNEVFVLEPQAGFHFNPHAPLNCGEATRLRSSPHEIRCQATAAPTITVRVPVCDDKESFCKIETVLFKVRGNTRAVKARAAKLMRSSPVAEAKMVNGFINNDLPNALAQAQKNHRPLLIDVYAKWCPPCNQLDESVFNEKSFQAASAKFIKVRVDADLAEAWDFREHYRIQGLPTLLAVTADGDEIGRVSGFKSANYLKGWLKREFDLANVPISTLAAKTDEAAKIRLAAWHLSRDEAAEAKAVLNQSSSPAAAELLGRAEVRRADQQNDVAAQCAALETLLTRFGQSVRASGWLQNLHEIDPNRAAPFTAAVLKNLKRWRADPPRLDAQDLDVDVAELWLSEAAIDAWLKDETNKNTAFTNAITELNRGLTAGAKVPKGIGMRKSAALLDAGRSAEALALLRSLVLAYPQEYPLNHNYARALYAQKKFAEALPYVTKAESLAYGDNWLREICLKAKVLNALSRKAEAIALIDQSLAQTVLPRGEAAWTHYRVADLREVREKIQRGQSVL